MKTRHRLSAFLMLTTLPVLLAVQVPVEPMVAREIVEKGAHHRVWSHVTRSFAADGQVLLRTNRYTELAIGLHYKNELGEWVESQEIIDIVPGGALASKGPHQVGFAANANTVGAIDMVTPDGKRLRSHVLGLAYISARTGQSVWIAQIRDSIGEQVRENQILYRDAFDDGGNGTKADIRYTYTRAGLEQDIIFRPDGAPPLPEAFGLNSADARLEVITEFIEAPAPRLAEDVLSAISDPLQRALMVLPDFVDQTIDFDSMRMEAGQAFSLSGDEQPQETIPTGKIWHQQDGRTFLIEAVEYQAVKPHLDALVARPAGQQQARALGKPGAKRSFPNGPLKANASTGTMKTAAAAFGERGFVIDYTLAGGSISNFTFKGDTTYLLTAVFTLWGSNNVLEGGAVIKQTNWTGLQLRIHQGLNCRTTPYHPAIFTSMHDDTVGDTIAGSTGNPTNYCGYMLWLGNSSGGYFNIHDIRISHATRAVYGTLKVNADISNVQITHSVYGPRNNTAFWNYRNVLMHDVVYGFDGVTPLTNRAEHITLSSVSNFQVSGLPAVNLTNSLLISVTNNASWVGTGVETNLSSADIFETVGSGAHYLPTNSPYLSSGTTNIDPTLLAALRQRTVFAPQTLSGTITTNLTLSPVTARDTNAAAVALGYHYEAVDYLFENAGITNATLTLTNGVCIAIATNSATGIRIDSGGRVISQTSPFAVNKLFRASSVGEQRGSNSTSLGLTFLLVNNDTVGTNCFRFTDFPLMAGIDAIIYTNSVGTFTFADCQFLGGRIETYGGLAFLSTNTLFERVNLNLDSGATAITAGLYHCLVRGGPTTALRNHVGPTTIQIFNTLFDSAGAVGYDVATGSTNAFNGYFATTVLSNSVGEVVVASLTNLTGKFGSYYQPLNSQFIDHGLNTAASWGYAHYTVTTNSLKDSSTIDIGLHYLTVDANGNLIDSDADGAPDYVEDRNGNGLYDSGENSFTSLSVTLTSPTNNATFDWQTSIAITAAVSVAGASLTSVEFFANTNSLGTDASAPYSLAWNGPGGIYNLTAIATDSSGWKATSAVATIYVNNALFVVGSTNLAGTSATQKSDNEINNELKNLGLYAQVKLDSEAVSSDANNKKLVIVSKSATAADVGTKFTSNAVPLITWEDQILDTLQMTRTNASDFGNTNGQTSLSIANSNHPITTGMVGTVTVSTIASNFSWGIPSSNSVKLATLIGSNTNRIGLFVYEEGALMNNLEAPARRVSLFHGFTSTTNLNSNAWRLFTNAVLWAIGSNAPPAIEWLLPTNSATFSASSNITLTALASDNDSGINRVVFYRNGIRVGSMSALSSNQYNFVWSNAPGGTHLMSAKVVDQGRLTAISTQFVNICVRSNVLFVVGSTNLNSGEDAIKTRLENRGYLVSVKAETNATTGDASGMTVVLLSATASASNITNKFTTTTTPVVCWQKDLFDDLGLTGTDATSIGLSASQTTLDVQNSSHPLAGSLSGSPTVTSNSATFSWGQPGSNAIKIATISGDTAKAVVFGYEKGKLLVGIFSTNGVQTNVLAAPARRVGFFLHTNAASVLNSNGWALFDAAIDWVLAKPCFPSVDVMFVVDNSQSVLGKPFLDEKVAGSNFIASLRGTDQVGLISFAATGQVQRVLTTNFAQVTSNLYALSISNGTRLDYAINMAQTELESTNHNSAAMPVIILFSDGQNESASSNDPKTIAAAENAKAKGTRLICVRFPGNADGGLMQTIASPDDFYFSPDTAELTDIYNAVAETLCLSVAPTVTIISPGSGAAFPLSPTNITITASAVSVGSGVRSVEFFDGTESIGIAVDDPLTHVYTNRWRPVFGGVHTLLAKAVDHEGRFTFSVPVTVTVNIPPSVSLMSPTTGTTFVIPQTNISLSATALDADGTIAQVEFFSGANRVGIDTVAPFSITWSNVLEGSYLVYARATDNAGAQANSEAAEITVLPTNSPPFVFAGSNQILRLPSVARLTGIVLDDGLLQNVPLAITWSQISGPGPAIFDDSTVCFTPVSFPVPGTYVLSLTAFDGQFNITNNTTITVLTTNTAPIVDAGTNQTLILPAVIGSSEPLTLGPKTTEGTEFWLTFMRQFIRFDCNFGEIQYWPTNTLFISSRTNTSGTVVVLGTSFRTNFTVNADSIATIVLPRQSMLTNSDAIETKAVHVTAKNEISVYGLNFEPERQTTEAFSGIPVHALGTEYFITAAKNYDNGACSGSSEPPHNGTSFAIVGAYDNTTVTITPSVTTAGHAANTPYTITLHEGQTYQLINLAALQDLSGSIVTADKPIAVFGGHQCALVPVEFETCQHLVEQLLPSRIWGKQAFAVPFVQRSNYILRVMASQNSTSVKTNGSLLATLNRAQWIETRIEGLCEVSANQPIQVIQYSLGTGYDNASNGDPFMVTLPSYEQFLGNYTIATPATGIASNYLNIVAGTNSVNAIKLDGDYVPAGLFTNIGTSGFAGAQIHVSVGTHTLSSITAFGITVYGYQANDTYGYCGGMALAPVATLSNLSVAASSFTNVTGGNGCMAVAVRDINDAPISGIRVDFSVSGGHTNSGYAFTDGSGAALYCYSATNAGTDIIMLSSGSVTNSVTNTWINPQLVLQGTATDDGRLTAPLSLQWTNISAPQDAIFSDTHVTNTAATFQVPGVYSLSLSAHDGELTSNDDVSIFALRNQAPVVNPGSGRRVSFTETNIVLAATATDDGLPGSLTVRWTQVGGSGVATFVNATSVITGVTFSAPGVYILRLSASDGEAQTFADVAITNELDVTIALSPTFLDSLVGYNERIEANVTKDGGIPVPGVQVILAIEYANATSRTNTTDGNGKATFYHKGVYAGLDRLTASVTINGITLKSERYFFRWWQSGNVIECNASLGEGINSGATDSYYMRAYGTGATTLTLNIISGGDVMYLRIYDVFDNLVLSTNAPPDVTIYPELPDGVFRVDVFNFGSFDASYSLLRSCNAVPALVGSTNAVLIPENSILFFPSALFGTKVTNTVRLTNVSSASYSGTSYGVSGDFTCIATPLSIAPGATADVQIVFESRTNGLQTGVFTLFEDGSGIPFALQLRAQATTLLTFDSPEQCALERGSLQHVQVTAPTETVLTWRVSGANTASATNVGDVSGVGTFTYWAANSGTDFIHVEDYYGAELWFADGARNIAQPIACGEMRSAVLVPSSGTSTNRPNVDSYLTLFSFDGSAGDQVAITLRSTSFDTLLYLRGPACTLLATNDDWVGTDSKLEFTLPSTGKYLIEATSFLPKATGAFTATLTCVAAGTQPRLMAQVLDEVRANYTLFDFGTVTVSSQTNISFILSNAGTADLFIDQTSITGNFSLLSTPPARLAVGEMATFDIRFNASSIGVSGGQLRIDHNESTNSPFILNLQGVVNPTGTPPTVVLSAPVNSATLAQTTIGLAATASAATGTIDHVEFGLITPSGYSVIDRDSAAPYEVSWRNVLPAQYRISARATDSGGRISISPPVYINVTPATNQSPVANDDFPVVVANVTTMVNPLLNDSDANGDSLQIIGATSSVNGGAVSVAVNGSALRFTPPPNAWGNDAFTYTISDGHGGIATGWVFVTIPIPESPTVTITSPANNLTFAGGDAVTVTAGVTAHNGTIARVEVYQNDQLLATEATPPYSIAWSAIVGTTNLTAIAFDSLGQEGAASVSLTVTQRLADVNAPVAIIINLTNQVIQVNGNWVTNEIAVVRDGIFVLRGSAYDLDGDSTKYKLRLYRVDGTFLRDLAPDWIAKAVTNGPLFTNDFTLLRNDIYQLELLVSAGGREASHWVAFALESDLKIGQFSFSQQDLVIPVNGMPLSVIRTYSTLNPNSGEFGNSWTYAINDLEMSIDEDRADVEDLEDEDGKPQIFSLRVGGGRDVTLTLPDGRRTTFGFYLEQGLCNQGDDADFCFFAKWLAPPNVHYTLTPVGDNRLIVLGNNAWWAADASMTFENFDFPAFDLTARDGTVFRITREDLGEHFFLSGGVEGNYARAYGKGKLTKITQRTGDTISIGPNSIVHTNPAGQLTRSITFQRDANGRIWSIVDPNSTTNVPAVKYQYDYFGNLVHVLKLTDRASATYETNTYIYGHPNFPSYITEIRDARGFTPVRSLFDDGGRLIGIVDANGRTNRFVHDLAANTEISYDRQGNPTMMTYDNRGNITNVIDAVSGTNSFTYDANGAMTSHRDPLGNITTYSNDAQGNVLSVTLPYPAGANPTNYITRFTYNTNGEQTSIRLPTGAVITNEFDPNTGLLLATRDGSNNVISRTTYNALGLATAEGDVFGTNSFAYDSLGNARYFTNSLGKLTTSDFDANGNLTNLVTGTQATKVQYDAQGRELSADYGNGITVNYTNEAGLDWKSVSGPTIGQMERRFDEQGRLAGWKTANNATPGFSYDESGRLKFETNSLGVVTVYSYDAVGRATIISNAVTQAAQKFGYDPAGRRIAETNAVGTFTLYGFNPDGSVVAMTNAFGTNYWLYNYEVGGGCCGGSGGGTNTVTDPLGRDVIQVQSAYGLPLQTIFKSGMNQQSITTAYAASLTTPEQEAQEYPESVTDEGGRVRQFRYTALGQLERATDLGGNWYTNQYDADSGALLRVIGPTGETNNYVYDDLDNVKAIGFSDGIWLTNSYSTGTNRLQSMRFPSGATNALLYDFAGRLTNRASSIGEVASFQYNANDAVTVTTDNTGSTTNLFDAAGRLYGINYPWGATVRYGRDLLDRVTSITNKATTAGANWIVRYSYDAIGNITNVSALGQDTRYEYDRVGRRTKRVLPNGVVTDWKYDWRDRLTNVLHTLSGSTVSFGYVRAPGGEPTRITREDGTYVELKYDAALRLTNEVYRTSGGSFIDEIGYGYDAAGNRVRLLKGGTTLTNAVSGGYRISAIKNAADGTTAETYGYDNGGRVTSMTRDGMGRTFGYNTADQLTAVTNGSTWIAYTHDAAGRRTVATNSSSVVRRFVVAGTPGADLESPLFIADQSGNVQQGFVYLGREPLLRFDARGTPVYYLEDAMGSIAALADGSGAKTASFNYDGFGNIRSLSGNTNTPAGTEGDFRFHGAWWEKGSDLYHMRAREYDQLTGRFVSRDPLPAVSRIAESFNPTVFAHNNPFIYADPSGSFTVIEISVSGAIDKGIQGFKEVAVSRAKAYAKDRILDTFSGVAQDALEALYPGAGQIRALFQNGIFQAGVQFEDQVTERICQSLGLNSLRHFWFGVPIAVDGSPTGNGVGCAFLSEANSSGGGNGVARPDFVLGDVAPLDARAGRGKSVLLGDLKLSGNSLYNQYVLNRNSSQFKAIGHYASRHTYTRTAVFLTVFSGDKQKLRLVGEQLRAEGFKNGVIFYVFAAVKNKNGGF